MQKRFHTSIIIANGLDHYDTALYGFMVPLIAPYLFDQSNYMSTLLQGYGVLLAGILTRPLGAIYFANLAEKNALKAIRVASIGIMIATIGFVFIQPVSVWGWGTALCCLVIRAMQSFCAAGEVNIASLLVLDNVTQNKKNKISGFFEASTMVGILAACFMATLIGSFKNPIAYWKLPFILSGATYYGVFLLRKNINEKFFLDNHLFDDKKARCKNFEYQDPNSLRQSSKQNIIAMLTTVLKYAPLKGFSYVTYSFTFILIMNLLSLSTKQSFSANFLVSNSLFMVLDLLLIILISNYYKLYNPVTNIYLSIIGFTGSAVLFLFYINTGAPLFLFFLRCLLIFFGVIMNVSLQQLLHSTLERHNRFKINALSGAIGTELIGRSLPYLGLLLFSQYQSIFGVAIYIIFLGCIALYCLKTTAIGDFNQSQMLE